MNPELGTPNFFYLYCNELQKLQFNLLNMLKLTDNELMMKVKAGEIARLGLLFERHHKSLFGFFYRTTAQVELCEDLVQNVFEKILKNRKQFKGYGKFTTWMFSIARNELADHFKKHNRRPESTQFNIENEVAGTEAGYFEQEQQREEMKVLEMAFGSLDEDKRQLLSLSKYQGMSYRQIGEVMNCTEGNARIKVFRAMQELRNMYQKIEKQVLS